MKPKEAYSIIWDVVILVVSGSLLAWVFLEWWMK